MEGSHPLDAVTVSRLGITQNGAQNGAPFFSQNGAERRTAQNGNFTKLSL